MVTQEAWEELADSYIKQTQFLKGLEEGIHCFKAIDSLTNQEIDDIRHIFIYILDQWDDANSVPEKNASMNALKTKIESLGESENKAVIKDIFESLKKISPDVLELDRRNHTIP
jgi:hypothetical protein